MKIQLLPPIINAIQKGILQGYSEAVDKDLFLVHLMKRETNYILRNASEFVVRGVWVPASIVAGAFRGFKKLQVDPDSMTHSILSGAVQGSLAVEITEEVAIQGSVAQFVYESDNPSYCAYNAISGVLDGLKSSQKQHGDDIKVAVLAYYEAADSIDTKTALKVEKVLVKKFKESRSIIKSYRKL